LPAARDEADDELARAFPGCSFAHLLAVTSGCHLDVAVDILSAVKDLGGELDFLRIVRVAGLLEHRFRLTGLLPAQVRCLLDRLSAMSGIKRATVEYQILRNPE
jgi:hypothetical protein